ncbi:hypothetical protein VE03_03009 [Pseudogymnoascus sp. 23342-1-I1]|nr:hypothetical protein VE03_03009 [Pseudogymnoascus sp. 23342-1-I1]
MDAPPLDYGAAMADFKAAREKYTKTAACGREYVLVSKLRLWLGSRVPQGADGRTQTSRLLAFAYRGRSRDKPVLPIMPEVLSDIQDGCLLVFCILFELGRGDLIHLFFRQYLLDRYLPIPLQSLRDTVKKMPISNRDELAEGFNNLQWRFCPVKFEMSMERYFPENQIMPFCKREKINDKGGTAQLWQIEVPEEFIGPNLAKAIKKEGKYDAINDSIGPRYHFALKTFDEGSKALFENEKDAFRALRHHAGMVRYLGDYEHVEVHESTIKTTSNIILEYGDHDLDDYFMQFAPPVFQSEITSFWECLFDVAYAVEGIHHLKVNTDGLMQEFNGWHADIKPDNILIVQGQFKLADPGFTTFVKKTETEPKKVVAGGTETYGAPERRYSRSDTRAGAVSQTIDTWSLGCVFSIAATWVVLGHEGIRQFAELRRRSIRKIIEEQAQNPTRPQLTTEMGAYFHNGEEVLLDVLDWHIFLRRVLRKSDVITSSVLDLIDEEMLVGNAGCRIKANDLCERLDKIKSQIQNEATAPPKAIMEALLAVDEAPPRPTGARTTRNFTEQAKIATIAGKRQAQKSALLGAPLKVTARRSEYLKSELSNSRVSIPITEEYHDIPFIVPSSQTLVAQNPNARLSLPTPRTNTGQISATTAIETTPRRYTTGSPTIIARPQHTSKKSRATPPQDVFEALENIKLNLFGNPVKDKLMSKYFKDRDIKFLVDNAGSMKPHWSHAKFLLKALLLKVAGQDEDGMDLTFTSGKTQVQDKKGESKFIKAMERPDAQPSLQIRTDMKQSLGEIFQKYLDTRRKGSKKLTLIVLTDGKWDGMEDKNGVDAKIITFAKQLNEIAGSLEVRPVSIEFIQFGNDPDATSRLRRLDNHLVYAGIPDIVDTEHSTGDVNKMLLGSFVEEYDRYDDEDDDEPTLLSPVAELDAGPITESPYQQPTGYFPTSSNADNGLFQTQTGSSMGPQVRRNTSTAGLEREPSTRSARHIYHPR